MAKLTIRCHPCTPAGRRELQNWLEDQVNELRVGAEHEIIRLSRVTQELPGGDIEMGWLLELELLDASSSAGRVGLARRLADVVRDMRLLGLQPTALAPLDISDWRAAATADDAPNGRLSSKQS